ncbi:uncharacterized protein LOC144148476 [Haemaphysalis longicornis]
MKSAADGKELRSGTVVGATAPDTAFSEALTTVAGLCQALTQHLGTLQDPAPRLQPDIPTYRGYDDRLSVADFLDKLDYYKAAVGASDTHMLTRVLPLVFQGPAACWWRLQSPFASWATFVVPSEFLPPGYDTRILRELDLRTQHPNESLLEYVRAMQELYRRAAPETTSAEQVARVLRQCHPWFQPYLYAQTYADLNAVASNARAIQECLLAKLQYAPPPTPSQSLEPSCAWNGPGAFQSWAPQSATHRALDPGEFAPRRRPQNRYRDRTPANAGYGAVGHPVPANAGYGAVGHPVPANVGYGAVGHPVPTNVGYGAVGHPVPANVGYGAVGHPVPHEDEPSGGRMWYGRNQARQQGPATEDRFPRSGKLHVPASLKPGSESQRANTPEDVSALSSRVVRPASSARRHAAHLRPGPLSGAHNRRTSPGRTTAGIHPGRTGCAV